jgi:hypothetical protein
VSSSTAQAPGADISLVARSLRWRLEHYLIKGELLGPPWILL